MRIKNGVPSDRPTGEFGESPQRSVGQSPLQILLLELATVLLQRGVTPPQFNELAKQAFIAAAANLSRFRNGKINQSRVSVLTGLRRAEVRRSLSHMGSPVQPDTRRRSPIEAVIAGWCADKRYADRGRDPKRLAIAGTKASFATLVKLYAGDVPHRAVLTELTRLGVVRQIGKHVEVKSLLPLRQRQNFASLSNLILAVADGIRSASDTRVRAGVPSVRRLVIPAHNLFDLETIRERCTSSIETMLGGLSASLEPRRMGSRRSKQTPHSCSVSIILGETRSL